MKNTKQIYTIWQTTTFGHGMRKIKAWDFEDAFNKIGKNEKSKLICICEFESGEERDAEYFGIINN